MMTATSGMGADIRHGIREVNFVFREAPKRAGMPAMPKPSASKKGSRARPQPPWTFLTNHAHVLVSIARDPEIRMRDLALAVGVTERAVQRIVAELADGGYLRRERSGRRNRYEVRGTLPLRHPIERHRQVAELIRMVLAEGR
jgi:DNA-binding transcriptional ArsR family regulator